MSMKKIFIIVFCLSLFNSCKYFRGDNCNNTLPIVGVYKNIYDKEAENILIIKKDGTFEQKFTKKGEIKTSKGTWSFFEESCNVYFNGLKLFHKVKPMQKRFFSESGVFRLNKIMFNEDMRVLFDFYRID